MKVELLKENMELIDKLKEMPVLHAFGKRDIGKLFSLVMSKDMQQEKRLLKKAAMTTGFISWWEEVCALLKTERKSTS